MTKRAVGAPEGKKPTAARKTSTKPKPKPKAPRERKTKAKADKPATPTSAILLSAEPAPDLIVDLTPAEVAFVELYLANNLNGTAAMRKLRPGITVGSASVQASRMLGNAKVREHIERERRKLTERYGYTKDDLFKQLVAIVLADPSELSQVRHVSCDACWGGEPDQGVWADPDPDCKSCQGNGITRPWFADTRKLSPEARALYQSVELTRHGMKVNMESKAEARDKLAKMLGAYELDNKQKTDPLVELLNAMTRSALPVVHEKPAQGIEG